MMRLVPGRGSQLAIFKLQVATRKMFGCARHFAVWVALLLEGGFSFRERINQEGRIFGPAPVVTNSVLFNITNADAILSAMQIFPVTNPWNEDISRGLVLIESGASRYS